MKKFVTWSKNLVVLVMIAIIGVVITHYAGANANKLKPEVILEKPENSVYDNYEIHMDMYMTMPDYGDVIIKIAASRDDTEPYGNSGECKAYSRDGEYIDEIGGSIVVDYSDCRDVEDMINVTVNYVNEYESYEYDAEQGVTYEKIYIW